MKGKEKLRYLNTSVMKEKGVADLLVPYSCSFTNFFQPNFPLKSLVSENIHGYPPPPNGRFFHFNPPSTWNFHSRGICEDPPLHSRISVFSLPSFKNPLEVPSCFIHAKLTAHTATINSFYYSAMLFKIYPFTVNPEKNLYTV